ncbi:zinc finger and BTB domain-containing protein 11 [Gastrophryne carolinensis]
MASEESYLAILRYLTNEREPYAPGTEGNAKRKIRKAAACYVVREGTLYYQRRQRDRERFSELEVVLQSERRREIIMAAHTGKDGEHLTRLQTWQLLSQRYWWRGILKEMKDYIKKCSKCQEKGDRTRSSDPIDMLEEFGLEVPMEESEEESSHPASGASADPKHTKKKPASKHELIFVDSKGLVRQSSSKHGQAVLDQLNHQRLANQFCDVTLLIEGEEYKAHKSVLAANSEYFRELFIEKGAVSSHEAFVDLSGFCKSSFLPLLEFSYTSELCFDFCNMAELAMLARHLFMHEVLEICEFIHKRMEEKQITLYQRGDVQTVTAEKKLRVHLQSVPGRTSSTTVVVEEVAHNPQGVNHDHVESPTSEQTQSRGDTIATPQQVAVAAEVLAQLTGHNIPTATTLFISAPSELQSTVLIPTVIEAVSIQPESQKTLAQNTDTQPSSPQNIHSSEPQMPSCENSSKDSEVQLPNCTLQAAAGNSSQVPPGVEATEVNMDNEDCTGKGSEPLTKKRSRPSKSPGAEHKMPVVDPPDGISPEETGNAGASTSAKDMSSPGSSASTPESPPLPEGDQYKGKLRERAIEVGGYIHMHRGKDRKHGTRKTNPKSAVQQAARRLVEKGKKMMLPPKNDSSNIEEEHKCKECGAVFLRKYALIMHSMRHDHKKEYNCPLCKKDFQYRASLRAHLIRHSRKTEPSGAEDRVETQGPIKREFICNICGRTLPKMCALRVHMLKHTGVKPHSCQICRKSFIHKNGLRMHMALHDTAKQFKCQLCDKSFVTNRSLQEHVSTHTGEMKYLCTVCGKTYHRASGLSKHLKKHKPKPEVRQYHCTQCERSFYEIRDLQQHMNKHLGIKPFECEVCGKCYSWKKDWYSHVKSHSVTEPYRCNVCGKEFLEKSLFRRHVKKATHGKKGRTKRNIERVCAHCGKTFTQLREFRRHINNHEGVKPFECLTCGVAWADARSLKRHVRTHTGERPYVCPVCNEAFIDARNLRKHMTKHHGNYIPCKIMLEKDSLQFHHQGTQVEHAVTFVPNELSEPQPEIVAEEIETVLVTEDVIESAGEVTENPQENPAVSSLSDQSIMQVVNYVLSHQGGKPQETDQIETVEVEVGQVTDVL